MTTHCQTNVGKKRSTNEDAVRCTTIDALGELLVVADGMGGHPKGDVASERAVETVVETVEDGHESGDDHATLLERGVRAAQDAVLDIDTQGDPGTTLVTALVADDTATIANVGDSRAYRVGDDLEQVTIDHSHVQQLVEAGELSPDEAEDHPMSHVVSQALGTADTLDVDTYEQPLTESWLLLCSDGLSGHVPEEEIEQTCHAAESIEDAGSDLIELALAHGAPDNVTVGLYESE